MDHGAACYAMFVTLTETYVFMYGISFLGYAESAVTVLSAFHVLIILTLTTILWGVYIIFFAKRQILMPSHMLASANNPLIFSPPARFHIFL